MSFSVGILRPTTSYWLKTILECLQGRGVAGEEVRNEGRAVQVPARQRRGAGRARGGAA